jgi:acetolactate synthase-1/2/3 large subunit
MAATNFPPGVDASPAVGESMASALAQILVRAGVTHTFGVTGSAIAPFARALSRTPIVMVDCRHESGAAFAATEASIASGRMAAVFTTAGPGFTNALTGMLAARWEGAHVVLVSGATSTAHSGRWAVQETSFRGGQVRELFRGTPAFDFAATLESGRQLDAIERALRDGARRPSGFTAHLSFPINVQMLRALARTQRASPLSARPSSCAAAPVCARLLRESGLAIWVGFGARHAASEIRELAERTGARVICSPRAKGVFPESHPLFVGVTGVGGHEAVADSFALDRPERLLVLGTRLGEATSLWSPDYLPRRSFVHVDVDRSVFGAAYPRAATIGVEEDVGMFLRKVLSLWGTAGCSYATFHPRPAREPSDPRAGDAVRPRYLMNVVQRRVVDETPFGVMAECGNALLWATHHLRFDRPHRFRASPGFGSMGHMTTGVVGAALARGNAVVAIVGDGAMLMQSEVSTAVQHRARAVWIVLNDGRYGIVEQGMRDLGWHPVGVHIAPTDFAAWARALGCASRRVTREADLDDAVCEALDARGPFVIDVVVAHDLAPIANRQRSIVAQLRAGASP